MRNQVDRYSQGMCEDDSWGHGGLAILDQILRNFPGACGGMFIQSVDGRPAQSSGLKPFARAEGAAIKSWRYGDFPRRAVSQMNRLNKTSLPAGMNPTTSTPAALP